MAVPGPVRTSSSLSAAESIGKEPIIGQERRNRNLKAPSFAYAKPRALEPLFELLERPGTKILAGGQSLIPSLNMRLSSPELLIDITGISALKGIALRGNVVRIGALATHSEIENSPLIRERVSLLSQ